MADVVVYKVNKCVLLHCVSSGMEEDFVRGFLTLFVILYIHMLVASLSICSMTGPHTATSHAMLPSLDQKVRCIKFVALILLCLLCMCVKHTACNLVCFYIESIFFFGDCGACYVD